MSNRTFEEFLSNTRKDEIKRFDFNVSYSMEHAFPWSSFGSSNDPIELELSIETDKWNMTFGSYIKEEGAKKMTGLIDYSFQDLCEATKGKELMDAIIICGTEFRLQSMSFEDPEKEKE